jgi:hypothetical protein
MCATSQSRVSSLKNGDRSAASKFWLVPVTVGVSTVSRRRVCLRLVPQPERRNMPLSSASQGSINGDAAMRMMIAARISSPRVGRAFFNCSVSTSSLGHSLGLGGSRQGSACAQFQAALRLFIGVLSNARKGRPEGRPIIRGKGSVREARPLRRIGVLGLPPGRWARLGLSWLLGWRAKA